MSDKELLYEVARLTSGDNESILWWVGSHADPEDDSIHVGVNCSDVFFWGCSDSEEVTPENLGVLRQAIADVDTAIGDEHIIYNLNDALLLFCARVRGERPQGAMYKYITVRASDSDGLNEAGFPKRKENPEKSDRYTAALRALFDAAGPEREVGLGNPYPQPGVNDV